MNQRAPSGPAVIAPGPLEAVGIANSVMQSVGTTVQVRSCVGSRRPTGFTSVPVNQRAPSGPVAMLDSRLKEAVLVGVAYSVSTPAVVKRPIREEPNPASVIQRAPSGPAVMLKNVAVRVSLGRTVTVPAGVM